MSRMRVLEIAKELGLDTKTTILKLQEIGVQVKNHFNAVSDADAEKLRALVKGGKKGAAVAGKGKAAPAKVVIRRRAAEPEAPTEATQEERTEQIDTPEPIAASAPEPQEEAPKAAKPVSEGLPQETKPETQPEAAATPAASKTPLTPPPAPTGGATIVRSAPPPTAGATVVRPANEGNRGAVIVRRDPNQPNVYTTERSSYGNTYHRPQGQGQGQGQTENRPSYQTRPGTAGQPGSYRIGPAPGARDGQGQGQGQGGYRSGPGGAPQRDSGGYRPSQGASATSTRGSFTPPPATDAPPITPTRPVRDKDRDHQKRTRFEEEEHRKAQNAKRKNESSSEFEVLDEYFDELGEPAPEGETTANIRTVYTPLPNRKKGSFSAMRKKENKKQEPANPTKASKKVVRINDTISVNDLSNELSVKSSSVIKSLMGLGMMATVNQVLDFDTVSLVAQEFGFEAQNVAVSISDILNKQKKDQGESFTRPPIVTIMGHVDHGKTSLLDAIRETKVADKETGGITQHIGAYQVEFNSRRVTFLDTPGHEAFTAMRSRGAQLTDIVILVVAADDGVMPQTVEAINHTKAAGVPMIVAINKIDKPGSNLERLQADLAQHGVTSEEWGGENMFVKVSAKTREGLDTLLESILLQADVLDLKSPTAGQPHGIVVESRLDKSRGPVATMIVQSGTLKQGEWIVAGTAYGRIRAMLDSHGKRLEEALPATPVEVLGLSEVPASGDAFNAVANEHVAKEAVSYRIQKQKEKDMLSYQKTTLDTLFAKMSEETEKSKDLPVIVKADTHGSVEAIRASLKKLDHEKVKTRIIHWAVGGITETDVVLSKTSGALIVGFNVRPDRVAAQVAERDGVSIMTFGIIYELIDAVQSAMAGRLAPIRTEKVQGHAEVRSLFSVPKIGVISGSAVTDGKIVRNSMIRVIRDGTVIYTGRVSSLKRFKDDAKEVLQGFECGIGVENYNDLKVGDSLESFIIEETAATLD